MRPTTRSCFLAFGLVIVALLAACAQEEAPVSASAPAVGAMRDASAGPAGPTGPQFCTQSRAESLPARLVAMSTHAAEGSQVVLVSQLYDGFVSSCGICHGAVNAMGGFQIATPDDFTLAYIQKNNVVAHITSTEACPVTLNPSNPSEPMPPCGQPNAILFSQRSPNDEVYVFEKLLEQWIAAGGPQSFTPTTTAPSAGDAGGEGGAPVSQYAMTPANGDAMTNIGNCIPSPGLVDLETTKSKALDAMFAAATSKSGGTPAESLGLPEKLSQTDLFTLDSETLAQYGVIAYAPGYPLWSDDAGKIRYVRVPRGQSIHFDKATQTFDIPPNTRFYKTFMKQIADTDGSYRYRKIETRLIVARPDVNNPDGTAQKQTALFGTYRWSDDEADATLVENLLYSGVPFPDTVLDYNTDEQLAAAVLAGQPADPEEALLEAHAIRHYAIPSSQRCIQCHMGSPSQDFVLGFTPLQINRRPTGTGGTIEDKGVAGPDELTQLQRLIDYGVITGIDSLSDVLPLEQSQGSRAPRNDQELVAQGYLLGNCAHCHNPRGYPTSIQPLLTDTLDFLPSATTGGIFQFPLERYSPDIFRGRLGNTPIPFITPSLMDLPRQDLQLGQPSGDIFFGNLQASQAGDGSNTIAYAAFAPWRSLIYRNVSSSFTYEDDLALYPHMPMNTPGFDPRAKRILSDWMVSIPAVRKHPEMPEYAYYSADSVTGNPLGGTPDSTLQPYVEVMPGDPRYPAAQSAATQRLIITHSPGMNPAVPAVLNGYLPYNDPGDTTDILDPATTLNPTCHPTPQVGAISLSTQEPAIPSLPFIDHPHWVVTDLSQLPGYTPRRTDWASILVDVGTGSSAAPAQTPALPASCVSSSNGVTNAYNDELDVISLDQSATLDATFTTFATTPRPMGLWQQKPGCDFSSQHTVSSYPAGTEGAHWMTSTVGGAPPPPTAPVYEETAGAEVFKMICINCHGKRADGNGFIAQNLANLTGGLARVADFHDGFFGPSTSPGDNRHAAFGAQSLPAAAAANWTGVTDDDRAARYMVWMALGGTEVIIPSDVLQIVGVTPVLGVSRDLGTTSANMLASAKALCASLLGSSEKPVTFTPGLGYLDQPLNKKLLYMNGDAELWLKMCSLSNPSAVHVIPWAGAQTAVPLTDNGGVIDFGQVAASRFITPAFYAANATTVGNESGQSVSISGAATSDGAPAGWPEWPWCLDTSTPIGTPPPAGAPICPSAVSQLAKACNAAAASALPYPTGCMDEAGANRWAVRGAMNAGFSVYLYVKALETMATPPPDYNQCEQLQ
jgi:mono/diheme cytochrome c family protein